MVAQDVVPGTTWRVGQHMDPLRPGPDDWQTPERGGGGPGEHISANRVDETLTGSRLDQRRMLLGGRERLPIRPVDPHPAANLNKARPPPVYSAHSEVACRQQHHWVEGGFASFNHNDSFAQRSKAALGSSTAPVVHRPEAHGAIPAAIPAPPVRGFAPGSAPRTSLETSMHVRTRSETPNDVRNPEPHVKARTGDRRGSAGIGWHRRGGGSGPG